MPQKPETRNQKMKKYLAAIAFIAAVVALTMTHSTAQLNPPTVGTILVIANVTSNTPVGTFTIDCRRQQNVSIMWEYELGGAGTEVMGLRFVPSSKADAIATTPTLADGFYIAQAANGATTVRATTNFNVKGYPYLHCYYITNGNGTFNLTNRISFWAKPNAP